MILVSLLLSADGSCLQLPLLCPFAAIELPLLQLGKGGTLLAPKLAAACSVA